MHEHDLVIVAAKRTPLGTLSGSLSTKTAQELAACAHLSALKQAGISASDIDEVIMGCVLSAGLGQAPARQSALLAHIPSAVGATTINKMCGSGMKSVMMACDMLAAGSAEIILAGGMESMSNAPYLLPKARQGYRLGNQRCLDHLLLDGLEDAYTPGKLMGAFADETAEKYHITREAQDNYAIRSMAAALETQKAGLFDAEIAPVVIKTRKEENTVTQDESPDPTKLSKVTHLKPAFSPHGTVTAANASSIADGAASLIITTREIANHHGLTPLARIVAYASHAEEPAWFTLAPIHAIKNVLEKAQWEKQAVDLYEINEAFAVVTLVTQQALDIPLDKINIHGGACALGHPIGASGARILVTLLYALQQQNKNKGVASLCIGGGEAVAMAIELS
jgi:acetyl-CoA C-acetyltransferase